MAADGFKGSTGCWKTFLLNHESSRQSHRQPLQLQSFSRRSSNGPLFWALLELARGSVPRALILYMECDLYVLGSGFEAHTKGPEGNPWIQ